MINQKIFIGAGGIYRNYKLNNLSSKSWKLIWKPVCASTEIELSNWIQEEPVKENQPKAIFASCQRFGKGQIGRYWHSPKGGVWVSSAIKKKGLGENNSHLYGLAVALALVERIEKIGVNVKIKWPNDLYVDGKKLAGVLPRLFFRGENLRLLRAGIGLNVFNSVPIEGVSLKNILGKSKLNLNFWSSEVLFAIERSLDFLENKKYLCSQVEEKLWSKKYIDKVTGNEFDVKGIDADGKLILLINGKEKTLST